MSLVHPFFSLLLVIFKKVKFDFFLDFPYPHICFFFFPGTLHGRGLPAVSACLNHGVIRTADSVKQLTSSSVKTNHLSYFFYETQSPQAGEYGSLQPGCCSCENLSPVAVLRGGGWASCDALVKPQSKQI